MFGFGSLIEKLNFNDKKHQVEETKTQPNTDWQVGSGWGDDDDIDDLIDDDEPAQTISPQKMPTKNEIKPQTIENKINTFGMVSKIFSRAGNFVANEITEHTSSGQQRKNDQQIMDLLLTENRQMRQVIQKQSAEMEEIKENQETLRLMEEETQDENEVLQYKVMSLEALVSMEQGKDLSHLKLIDELNVSKKDLQRQVNNLSREIKIMNSMQSELGEQSDPSCDYEDPRLALLDLKLLYEQNAIQFNEQDELRVLTALYIQEKPVIRMYRELLFQQIAKRALEHSEFLFKSMPAMTKDQIQLQSKIFIENKRLAAENGRIKKEIANLTSLVEQEQEDRTFQEARHVQKFKRMKAHAAKLQQQVQLLKQSLANIKKQTSLEVDKLKREFFEPKLNLISSQVVQFAKSQKAVISHQRQQIEKFETQNKHLAKQNEQLENKIINLQKETADILLRQEQDRALDANSTSQFCIDEDEVAMQKEMIEHLSQEVASLNDKLVDRETELAEANEMINHLEFENNRQFNHMQHEVKLKDEMLKSAQEQIRIVQQEEAQHHVILQNKIEDQANTIEELQANMQFMEQHANELEGQNQFLKMKLSHSPGSGLNEIASSQDVLPFDQEDSLHQIQQKNQVIQELLTKQKELEKMLEDKDEEIIELMQEVNTFELEKSSPILEQKTMAVRSEAKVAKPDTSVVRAEIKVWKEDADTPVIKSEIKIGKPDLMVVWPETKAAKHDTKVVMPQLIVAINEELKQAAIKNELKPEATKLTKEEQKNPELNFFDQIFAPAEKKQTSASKKDVDTDFFTSLATSSKKSEKKVPQFDDFFASLQEPTIPKTYPATISSFEQVVEKQESVDAIDVDNDEEMYIEEDVWGSNQLPDILETKQTTQSAKNPLKFDILGLETVELEKIFATAADKQKTKPRDLNLDDFLPKPEQVGEIVRVSNLEYFPIPEAHVDVAKEEKRPQANQGRRRSHQRSRGTFIGLVDEIGVPIFEPTNMQIDYCLFAENQVDQDVQHVVDQMQRNQERQIAQEIDQSEEEKSVNISDLGEEQEQIDEPIQQSKWAQDLDILNEAETSEEQSYAKSSSQPSQTVISSRNPSISQSLYNEGGELMLIQQQLSSTPDATQAAANFYLNQYENQSESTPAAQCHNDSVDQIQKVDTQKDMIHVRRNSTESHSSNNSLYENQNIAQYPLTERNSQVAKEHKHMFDQLQSEEDMETQEIASSSCPNEINQVAAVKEVQFSKENLIKYDEHDGVCEMSGHFGSEQFDEQNQSQEQYHFQSESLHHESAFFTKDAHIIKHATYGKQKLNDMIEHKLRLDFADDDSQEVKNEQSFAGTNKESENHFDANSDMIDQLEAMHQNHTFDMDLKGSMLEQSNMNSFQLESMPSLDGQQSSADEYQRQDLNIMMSHSEGSQGHPHCEYYNDEKDQRAIQDVVILEASQNNEESNLQSESQGKGWESDASLEDLDYQALEDEPVQKHIVPPLDLNKIFQDKESSPIEINEQNNLLSPEVLELAEEGWGNDDDLIIDDEEEVFGNQDTARSMDATFAKTMNILSALQDARTGLKEFESETHDKVQQTKLPKPEEFGWGDDIIDIEEESPQNDLQEVGPFSKIECNKGHKLTIMNGEVCKMHCSKGHELVKIHNGELGPLADETLGFIPSSEIVEDSNTVPMTCSACDKTISNAFWMCENLANSIKAASRGEDFIKICQDSKIICVNCICQKPELASPAPVKAEQVQEETKDILDFLNYPKPKPKVIQPKLEIQVQDDEPLAGGDTGGGWGDDEDLDI